MKLIPTLFAAAVVLKWIGIGYPATIGWFWIIGWWVIAATVAGAVTSYVEFSRAEQAKKEAQEELASILNSRE